MKSAQPLLRLAEPDDALPVARVHVRSWQVAYRGLLPDEYLDGLRPEERARHYTFGNRDPNQPATVIALMQETICGFATTAPARDPEARGSGELCALYVDPDRWGRGIGAALLAEACDRLVKQGFSEALLWAMNGNERALQFYRNHGWFTDGTRRTAKVWGITVDEVRCRRTLP